MHRPHPDDRPAAARARFRAHRATVLRRLLADGGHGQIDAIWSRGHVVAVGTELAAFVLDTDPAPEATLGMALANEHARAALIDRFIDARTDAEADRLGAAYWLQLAEVAA